MSPEDKALYLREFVPLRIAELKKRLAAREGQPGYKLNCEHLRREITELEALDTEPDTQQDGVTS